jgi:hypothetical protein
MGKPVAVVKKDELKLIQELGRKEKYNGVEI